MGERDGEREGEPRRSDDGSGGERPSRAGIHRPAGARTPVGWILVGLVVLAPALLATAALDVLSWWGRFEWLGASLLGVGLVTAPFRVRRSWGPARIGAALLAILLVFRLIAGGVSPVARLRVLPAGEEARWLDRLFEERDAAILGARVIATTGAVDGPELSTLAPRLTEAYDGMETELGHRMGSHVLTTFFGRDTGDAFSAYVIEPPGEPRGSVVFLHGSGGSFLVLCWQVAVAARAAGLTTVCPSTDASGRWSGGHGERIARAALVWARRGRVTLLVGLSAGAIASSRLAPDLAAELDGLVLISGADPRAADPALPTLAIQGDHDGMTPPELARAYRDAHPARVRLVELPGTHLLLLEQPSAVRAELTRFFIERRDEAERARAGASR